MSKYELGNAEAALRKGICLCVTRSIAYNQLPLLQQLTASDIPSALDSLLTAKGLNGQLLAARLI